MRFYLGAHKPGWLKRPEFRGVPLFISARRLRDQKAWPAGGAPWALDSGGFTELSKYGRWVTTAAEYVADARRWAEMVGLPEFAAPQDWMCEPVMISKTGLTVAEHQARTTANYLDLRDRAPEFPFAPVLQGWEFDDYLKHAEDYAAAGVDLAACPVVGIGSVCRRQATGLAESLIRELHGRGIRVHGFGFKIDGLRRCSRYLASSDSMAWSLEARRAAGPMPGCSHAKCANCPRYALAWRDRVMRAVECGERATQGLLFA